MEIYEIDFSKLESESKYRKEVKKMQTQTATKDTMQKGNLISELLDDLYGMSAEETKDYVDAHKKPPEILLKTVGNHSIKLGKMSYLSETTVNLNKEHIDKLPVAAEEFKPPSFLLDNSISNDGE